MIKALLYSLDVIPCRMVDKQQSLEGLCYLHLQFRRRMRKT